MNSETAGDRHFAKDQGRNFWSRWNLNSVLKDRDTSYSDKERAMGEGVTDKRVFQNKTVTGNNIPIAHLEVWLGHEIPRKIVLKI